MYLSSTAKCAFSYVQHPYLAEIDNLRLCFNTDAYIILIWLDYFPLLKLDLCDKNNLQIN